MTKKQLQRLTKLFEKEDRTKFEEGDLLSEVCSASPSSDVDIYREITSKTGYSEDQLKKRKRVAEAWPKSKRCKGASWCAHLELVSVPHRFDLIYAGMTQRKAEMARRQFAPGSPSGNPARLPDRLETVNHWTKSVLKLSEGGNSEAFLDLTMEKMEVHEDLWSAIKANLGIAADEVPA